MVAIVELKEQVARMADALQSREDRRMYQANYYKKRKEDKKKKAEELANARLPNTRGSHFTGLRKTNVPIKKWIEKMKQFGQLDHVVGVELEPGHVRLQPPNAVGRLHTCVPRHERQPALPAQVLPT